MSMSLNTILQITATPVLQSPYFHIFENTSKIWILFYRLHASLTTLSEYITVNFAGNSVENRATKPKHTFPEKHYR